MRPRGYVGVTLAAVAAIGGCAAIAGLDDPSDVAPVPDASDATTPPPDVAPAPEIGNGSGRDGPLLISDRRPVNEYSPLAKRADKGARSITLGKRDANVTLQTTKPGDVVLIVQSGVPGVFPPIDVSPVETETGVWDLARAKTVNGDIVELDHPLAHAFTVPGAQVVRVPQHTKVEIAAGGAIIVPRWDGLTGGILALLATEAVVVNGALDASGAGFRGARAAHVESRWGCSANEGEVDAGFAPRGEGYASTDAGFGGLVGGRGNPANGGGGGNCHNAGGGGGGNGGRGGAGGLSYDSDGRRAVGGIGGAALFVPPLVARLRFGGGGGAGEGNEGTAGNGGNGGGVVFVRAPRISGSGEIIARGSGGGSTGNVNGDGAGGGGAGGTILLDVTDPPVCARIAVTGGGGGNTTAGTGPGGAGGGGLVFLRGGPAIGCPIELQAGAAGRDNNVARGAGPPPEERTVAPYVGSLSTALVP